MDTKERVHQLVEESDEQILQAVEALLSTYKRQLWPEAEIKSLNEDIQKSEEDFNNDLFLLNEDAVKLSEKWRDSKK